MKVLIVGLGSIALKHIQALKELVHDVEIYALRSGKNHNTIEGVTNLYSYSEINFKPAFVIVSNPTAEHYRTLKNVAGLGCPVFIEKPALDNLHDGEALKKLFNQKQILSYVGFSLRFLPCLNYLKENIKKGGRINEVNVYCGSYLPEWRPGADFRKTYSANADMGGGVHLDLTHELDYLYWIFGMPENIKKNLRSNSSLAISSVDYANYYLEYKDFSANVVLNYFRRDAKRSCEIVMEEDTWTIDLLTNTVTSYKNGIIFHSEFNRADNYKLQMNYFLECISGKHASMNTLEDSLNVLKMCLHETT